MDDICQKGKRTWIRQASVSPAWHACRSGDKLNKDRIAFPDDRNAANPDSLDRDNADECNYFEGFAAHRHLAPAAAVG